MTGWAGRRHAWVAAAALSALPGCGVDSESTDPFGAGGAAGGTPGAGGTALGGTGATGSQPAAQVFADCRFRFGLSDLHVVEDNPAVAAELDLATGPWLGSEGDAFDSGGGQTWACDKMKAGGVLEHVVPVHIAYVAAGYCKRHLDLCDCNVGGCSGGNLCQHGAACIRDNRAAIVEAYRSFGAGWARCYGTTKPMIFELEPDYYQYTYAEQSSPLSRAEAASLMTEFVGALRESLPNAVFSLDISPWVEPNNGRDQGASWYASFDLSLFTFVNTSGGNTSAATATIRTENEMTWAGVSQVTAKPILAHSGVDAGWDSATNLNARIADGVVGVIQWNPPSDWTATLPALRGQLATPPTCP